MPTHSIRMKVTPHRRSTGMFYRITPMPKGRPAKEKYSRSMCANWFKKIFGLEPPSRVTYLQVTSKEIE